MRAFDPSDTLLPVVVREVRYDASRTCFTITLDGSSLPKRSMIVLRLEGLGEELTSDPFIQL
jgi:hypothetical protein